MGMREIKGKGVEAEMRLRCGYCKNEFEVTKEVVREGERRRDEFERALLEAFGVKGDFEKKTEYRIYCPKCKSAVGIFRSPLLGL